jgi:hypothetical protein
MYKMFKQDTAQKHYEKFMRYRNVGVTSACVGSGLIIVPNTLSMIIGFSTFLLGGYMIVVSNKYSRMARESSQEDLPTILEHL